MGKAILRVVFEKHGGFLNDPRFTVTLDEQTLHDGSFVSGFEATVETSTGPHRLTTAIVLLRGGPRRTREYDLVLGSEPGQRNGASRHVARLEYSRLWGNLTRKLDLRTE